MDLPTTQIETNHENGFCRKLPMYFSDVTRITSDRSLAERIKRLNRQSILYDLKAFKYFSSLAFTVSHIVAIFRGKLHTYEVHFYHRVKSVAWQ